MAVGECDTDLPCKEATFNSRHPFMQDESIFAPRLTISQAYAQLFEGKATPSGSLSTSLALVKVKTADDETESADQDSNSDFTPFDLFILIHCMALLSPFAVVSLTHLLQLSTCTSTPV